MNRCRTESDKGYDTAQKQIYFPVFLDGFDSPATHQPVIGMIEHDLDAKRIEQPVITFGAEALEKRIHIAQLAHTINHFVTLSIRIDH